MSGLVVGGTIGIDTIRAPWGSADRVLGGSASYAATAAALLSDGVELIGAVGGRLPLGSYLCIEVYRCRA